MNLYRPSLTLVQKNTLIEHPQNPACCLSHLDKNKVSFDRFWSSSTFATFRNHGYSFFHSSPPCIHVTVENMLNVNHFFLFSFSLRKINEKNQYEFTHMRVIII